MAAAFFEYGLPLLLGYALFAGVSGHLNPFARLRNAHNLASRVLGLWAGSALALSMTFAVQMNQDVPGNTILHLGAPGFFLLSVIAAPAMILFIQYSQRDTATEATPLLALLAPYEPYNGSADEDLLLSQEATEATEYELEALEHALDETIAHPAENLEDLYRCDLPGYVTIKSNMDDAELRAQLERETALRLETEHHLRITRKALSTLEAETRHFSIDKADGLIALEEQLADSIRQSAGFEAEALREKTRRIEVEQTTAELKRKMIKARQEIRRSTAARARALSTANKSIAFARQCVQIRSRLETSLEEALTSLEERQKTISTLTKALENRKRKTEEEICAMAQQLVLQEKHRQSRKSLEAVARSIENKLGTRLVKKVAVARPLMSGTNRGEAG